MQNEDGLREVKDGGSVAPSRPSVFVGIPTGNGEVTEPLMKFAASLANPQRPYRFALRTVVGVSPVEFARNTIAREFLKSGMEKLWMIDADVKPPMNVFELLGVDADIVAAACPVGDFGENLYLNGYISTPEGFRPAQIFRGTQEVDAVGFASVLIKRSVIEDKRLWAADTKVVRPWSGKAYELQAPPIFQSRRAADGSVVVGEDIDFCVRAKELGYKVVFVPGVTFGHKKAGDLLALVEAMYGAYEKGRAEGAAEAETVQQSKSRIILP